MILFQLNIYGIKIKITSILIVSISEIIRREANMVQRRKMTKITICTI